MAATRKKIELRGGAFVPFSSGLSALVPPKRGRPRLISDMALLQRRNNLLSTLERQWAEFAWEMQQAESMPSLRKTLRPIGSRPGMEMFVHAPTQKTDAKGFAALCKKIERTSHELGSAHRALGEACEHLARVIGALNDGVTDTRLKQLHQKYDVRHQDAKLHFERLDSSLKVLEGQRRNREAYLVQSQLLHFLTCKRYKITPVSLADAMAGAPFIAWRVSRQRCLDITPHSAVGTAYQKLQVLIQALATEKSTTAKPVDQVKHYLLRRKEPEDAINQLRLDWYYLRGSIEIVCSAKRPGPATPYRILCEYSRRLAACTAYDLVMANELCI